MTGFLYFLPDVREGSPVDEALLAKFGLSHIRDHKDQALHARGVVANGPGGLRGVVVGAGDRWSTEEVKQRPEIEWVKFPKPHAEKQAWLGWLSLPKPQDLARAHQLPGETLTLADGEKWLVPIARDFEGDCKLPIAYDVDEETGEWVPTKVRREYQAIWRHANAYKMARLEAQLKAIAEKQDTFQFDIPDGHGLLADSLAVNYRVSQRELATLGLLVTGAIAQVAEVLIDSHADHFKKKQDSDTGNG